jgi:hypothetical protein
LVPASGYLERWFQYRAASHRGRCKCRIELDSCLHGRDSWTPVKRVVRYDESFVADLQEFVGAVREQSPTPWLELTVRSNAEAIAARKSYDQIALSVWKRSSHEAIDARFHPYRRPPVGAGCGSDSGHRLSDEFEVNQ